jgi:5'-nucleotidase
MNILLTNDDGPYGAGLLPTLKLMREYGEVTAVCPAQEQSGVGHAITYLVPVRAGSACLEDGTTVSTLTGMPADCIKFALLELLDSPPDLIVSGLNFGINVGVDVFYSGTVAAALEGAFSGIFSIALSTSRQNGDRMAAVVGEARRALDLLLDEGSASAQALNVNIPALADRRPELRFTCQSLVFPRGNYLRMEGPRERVHYWLDSTTNVGPPEPDSDVAAIEAGDISVTPLRPDLTDAAALKRLRERLCARVAKS